MTLDEAIKHAEEVAENKYGLADAYHTDEGVYLEEETKCRMCAEEHAQLAMWLHELKLYRMNGTVAQIDGKWYVADDPKLKTVHGKTGEVVIGGFREVET